MGVLAGAVHLPALCMDGKRAAQAGIARGLKQLRVPAWDEDALTMAIQAGLRLDADTIEGPERLDRVRLFLDEPSEQAWLAARALRLDVPVAQASGPTSLLGELAGSGLDREELWLAGGCQLGGCGIAMRLSASQGPELVAASVQDVGSLGSVSARDLEQATAELGIDSEEEVHRVSPPGTPSIAKQDPFGLQVGHVGASSAVLELLAAWDRGQAPILLAQAGQGEALAVHLEAGHVPVEGLGASGVEMTPEAYQRRSQASFPAWSEASQGAYVSGEVYEADLDRRYGARNRGTAVVAARTTIQAGPPAEFDRQHEASGPYDVLILELDDSQEREIGQAAVPPGILSIGDAVRPVLRGVFSMEDTMRYGLKWWPQRGLDTEQ